MAFKLARPKSAIPSDAEELFRDLKDRKIPALFAHQADMIRAYHAAPASADIALQLPTGSGKTLVGLLLAEWRRRKHAERIVYLCPTRQLVNQVVDQARNKYGINAHAFVGKKSMYLATAKTAYESASAVAVTTYSSLFNSRPYFANAQTGVFDDAHAAGVAPILIMRHG